MTPLLYLQACPASVVCCSMEWNRWPANDAHSYPSTELHENLIREREEGGCLDVAMALKDQDRLFHSLMMKNLFPELIQSVKEEEKEAKERRKEEKRKKEMKRKAALQKEAGTPTWTNFNMFKLNMLDEKEEDDEDEVDVEFEYEPQPELTQEEREAIASAALSADLLDNFSSYERMFSMEIGGCREAGGARKAPGTGLATVAEEEDTADACVGAAASNTSSACTALPSTSSTTTAKPKKTKKFVYASVEPMKIITVRTFKIPTSYAARHTRIRNPCFYKRENQAVDTSDLGVAPGAMPVWEEVQV